MPIFTFDKILKIVQLVLNILLFAIKSFLGFSDKDEMPEEGDEREGGE